MAQLNTREKCTLRDLIKIEIKSLSKIGYGQYKYFEDEYQEMEKFLIMKSKLVQTHQEWIRGIREDIKDIQIALKSYRYLDEGIELANATFKKLDLKDRIDESQIIISNSTGLMINSPENVSDRIAQRNEAKLTREEKIALFQKGQSEMLKAN